MTQVMCFCDSHVRKNNRVLSCYFCVCGVYWTKFECISSKILIQTKCASDTLADSRVQKPKNFLAFSSRLLPPTPPPRSGKRNGKEIFGFASPFQSPKRAPLDYHFLLLFSPPSRRPRRSPIRV